MAQENNTTQVELSDFVKSRMEMIDWDHLKSVAGIDKETVMKNPLVATQLAEGKMTELVRGYTSNIEGEFSLRVFGYEEGKLAQPKVFTIESQKKATDRIYVYGQEIYSEAIKKNLFDRNTWEGKNGERRHGYANANAGMLVPFKFKDGVETKCLLSVHTPTNRIVVMTSKDIEAYFTNLSSGEQYAHRRQMYGTQFTDDDVNRLCEGKKVFLQTPGFDCWVQMDAAKREVVVCHPNGLNKEETQHMTDKLKGAKQQTVEEKKEKKQEKKQEAKKGGRKR